MKMLEKFTFGFSIFALIVCFILLMQNTTKTEETKNEDTSTVTETESNISEPCQKYSFFPDDEQRFILVDDAMQNLGGTLNHCYIYYDKYTKVMYLYMEGGRKAVMTPMLYETGEPMLFDEGQK